ncbi:MAG: PQQ-like beta-propeller repeat protein [Verrucomicrobia bacterium]|nr:PQQ-like beta-propeller repeat protein [Verrucomicrobiota bacterium]MDA1067867.1 PQQ-like beta-propeller repeat protein [Verrucomicrobiota bacterium]
MKYLLSAFIVCLSFTFSFADDWASWLGPTGDSVYHEKGIITSIPAEGLKILWEAPVAMGYSGPSVADGRVFLMDYIQRDGEITNRASWSDEITGQERVVCLDQKTGKLLWTYAYERPYRMSYASGPRCTTIYSEGKVYALGAEGDFNCLDANTGEVIWSKSFRSDYGAETPRWGHAAHPLVYNDVVICIVGGIGSVVVAFDKDTGEQRWRKLSADSQGYCPPSIIHRAGVDQLIIWHPEGLFSLNPLNGNTYWSHDLRPKLGLSVGSPRVSGSLMYVSGQGGPGALLKLSDDVPGAEVLWLGNPANALYPLNNTPVFTENALYGVDLEESALIAVDPVDGRRIWQTQEPVLDPEVLANSKNKIRHGTAFLIRQEKSDRYFIFTENGDLIVAEVSPAGYREIGRQNVLEPTNFNGGRKVVWSHPAFADKTMFARNDKKLIAGDLDKKSYLK